jgi:hypothetical protein
VHFTPTCMSKAMPWPSGLGMTNSKRFVVSLALRVSLASVGGCTLPLLPHSPNGPAFVAVPPCISGQVCGVAFDSSGYSWIPETIRSAR